MTKDEIARLSKWRLDSAKKKDSRRTERSNDSRRVIDIPEGRGGGHDGFDEEDAAKCANISKDPDFVLNGNVAKPGEWGEW